MAKAVLAFLLICAVGSPALAGIPQQIVPMSWLVGKTWSAKLPGPSSGPTHIDTHYYWASTGNFVEFTSKFVTVDGSVTGGYAGMFYNARDDRSLKRDELRMAAR